jgi:flagellar motor switch protein FliM
MGAEVLNQEEIDALLKGVDAGAVATGPGAAPGEVRGYDLATETRQVRGRLRALEAINERFARQLRGNLFGMLRREPGIGVAPLQVVRFGEYVQTLHAPCSLNFVKLAPLRGAALMLLDSPLVFTLVDGFFGGSGRSARIEGREFTSTESRVIQLVLSQAMADFAAAWAAVLALRAEYLGSETNPHFVDLVAPTEVVIVSPFRIDFENGGDKHGGEFHVALPYSMIEPIREVLDAGTQAERGERDAGWPAALREEIEEADVELATVLGHARLTLGRLLDLRAGDVIPCDFDGQVTLCAEGVPLLRGAYGASRGQQAVKIQGHVARRRGALPTSQTVVSP